MQTLVIVGAGPIGMTCALLLADRFDRVVLLERQSEERFLTTSGYTFPIVFSPAAGAVLDRVGVWEAIQSERTPYFGVVAHVGLPGREMTFTSRRTGAYSHWRHHIIASLHERLAAEGIEIRFGAEVTDIDFEGRTCTEASLGVVEYDLLLGADGMSSRTRQRLAEGHPGFEASEFESIPLDRWHAYRLPARGELGRRYGLRGDGTASHVHVTNPPGFRRDKVRVITTAMQQPTHEISIVVKHDAGLPVERVRLINEHFFDGMVDPGDLDRAWDEGRSGSYDSVGAPTFIRGSALLVGDAAHGFESTGDLINVGLCAVGMLPDHLDRHSEVPDALAAYDREVGGALRAYGRHALRRSRETPGFGLEVTGFELGARLGLTSHHPTFWGIYEEDFDLVEFMRRYDRTKRWLAGIGLGAVAIAAGGVGLWAGRRRA